MIHNERRRHSRTKINYPISYVCLGKTGDVFDENVGVVLDISQSGILIESVCKIASDYVLIISVDLASNLIEIRGKVVHSRKGKNDKYLTGVSFQGTGEKNLYFAKKLMTAYYYHDRTAQGSESSQVM